MKQKKTLFAATGIPSLFLIFGVLCLAVLALLTLGNSRSALSSARLSMEQTEQYYKACQTASDQVSQIQDCLVSYYKNSAGEDAYYTAVDRLSNEISEVTVDTAEHTVQFTCEFSDTCLLNFRSCILLRKRIPFWIFWNGKQKSLIPGIRITVRIFIQHRGQ